jgi:hypothetical protein
MTPNQITALSAEMMRVLQSQPELGVSGFQCHFTNSAANFPVDRAAAFRPDFAQTVASVLDCMTRWPAGISYPKTGREYAQMCRAGVVELPIGAVVVAFIVAGVRFKRIPGSPDISIPRRRS